MAKEDVLKRTRKRVSLSSGKGLGESRSQRFLSFVKSVRTITALIIFVVVLILTLVAASFAFSEEKYDKVPTCGDGTFYGKCSLDKPYYCSDGVLVERASVCGCPEGWNKLEDSCSSQYHDGMGDFSFGYLVDGVSGSVEFPVYGAGNNYVGGLSNVVSYDGSEVQSRADFKIMNLDDEVQRDLMIPLVKEIQNLAPSSKEDQARIAVSLVQNIPYKHSNETFLFAGMEVNLSRRPYEVLYDQAGICGEKSALLAFLLRDLGYGVSIFYFSDENHEAVGIKCPADQSLYGSGYCFVETGGPAIISDISMEFSDGVRLDSTPEVVLVSDGLSLPEDMNEYGDADTMREIRQKNLFGYLKFWKEDNIRAKYGLENGYSIH